MSEAVDAVEEIEFKDGVTSYQSYTHVAHAMYYSLNSELLWQEFQKKACVMMQVRFDGKFGFPGGMLDAGEKDAPVSGLNRELEEEIGLPIFKPSDSAACETRISHDDYVMTHLDHQRKLVAHFYAKQISRDKYEMMERNVLDAKEWGQETLGVFRVPLYTLEDGFRGLPIFLANTFAGAARSQLLLTLERRGIMTSQEIQKAVEACQHFQKKVPMS